MQNNIFSQIIHIRVSIRKEYFMKTQKVIIGLALCGALGGGGYVGWNTPTSISATYTGNQAYQNDTITSEDFSVTENNIFGKIRLQAKTIQSLYLWGTCKPKFLLKQQL